MDSITLSQPCLVEGVHMSCSPVKHAFAASRQKDWSSCLDFGMPTGNVQKQTTNVQKQTTLGEYNFLICNL